MLIANEKKLHVLLMHVIIYIVYVSIKLSFSKFCNSLGYLSFKFYMKVLLKYEYI